MHVIERPTKKSKLDAERVVVTVKIEENDKKNKTELGPPDCWSWRKYGQKPIKGSPHPRGYYRCSTSKGCSAKKQVERCKTDATMLIVTYTSTHNHPGRRECELEQKKELDVQKHSSVMTHHHPQLTTPKQEKEAELIKTGQQETTPVTNEEDDEHFPYYSQSPFNFSQDNIINIVNQVDKYSFAEKLETQSTVLYNDREQDPPLQPFSCHDPNDHMSSVVLKSEENDFYDELEELPTSSIFTAFMRSSFCEEKILVDSSN